MSTHPRTDYEECNAFIGVTSHDSGDVQDAYNFARTLEIELTAALARVRELEKEVSRWHKSFDGHVYVKSSEYAERALERESLTRQLSESQESLRLSQHDAAQERLRIVKLEGLLSESQAQLATIREANAVLQSQVDNADINLEQVRMTQKGLWRAKVESAESRIKELEAQLASAREDGAKLDWLEDRALSIELYGGEFRSNSTLNVGSLNIRSAIDSARGNSCPDCAGEPCGKCESEIIDGRTETPAEGETGKDAWKPIETAPKDGTLILVSDGVYVHEAGWSGAQWCVADSWGHWWHWWLEVKFWCALPPPPTGNEKQE